MEKSTIGNFIDRLKRLRENMDSLEKHEVVVGWVDKVHEQQRASKPKQVAIAINNYNRRNGKRTREIVSNFDADFIGPGIAAASLATIARTMNYGRAGGTATDGHEYGTIPARNFVKVLREKHMKPVHSYLKRVVKNSISEDGIQINGNDALAGLGKMCRGQLQRAMKDSNEYAANAPFTIKGGWMANPVNGKPFYAKGKGSSRPLWNHGTLINSVDFQIKDKG